MKFSLQDILAKLPVAGVVGPGTSPIGQVLSAEGKTFADDGIVWVSEKNAALLDKVDKGYVIYSTQAPQTAFKPQCTYLLTAHPRQYFANLVKTFFYEKEAAFISEKSVIDASVQIGKNVSIGAGAVIEKNCIIGDDCSIDSNTVIKKGTIIGARVKIGANNTIGSDGFGYEKNDAGQFDFIPHIGNVVIEDDVEIGNNTTIDRAVLGSTLIRKNAKIDNLVHIAHGVDIGENALVIAHAMIAGSVSIGANVWVAPSSAVRNKLSVGENAVIGIGAVVVKNVLPNQTIVGNPGKVFPEKKD